MSGGSFDYLFQKEVSEVVMNTELTSNLEHMATELQRFGELGCAAGAATWRMLYAVQKLRTEIDALEPQFAYLRNVWKAVEYRNSNDCSDEEVRKELKKVHDGV